MTTPIADPINIFSGEPGLGGALTNPNELAFSKGCIKQHYPVYFQGTRYADVERAYEVLGETAVDATARGELLIALIAAKFAQYPALAQEVRLRGGEAWLARCSHYTRARTPGAKAWEGQGIRSAFIRALIAGYLKAEAGGGYRPPEQQALF